MRSSTFQIVAPVRRNLLLAVVLALVAWAGLVACGGDADAATEFTREPAGSSGDNPFMASVETSAPDALAATDESATTTTVASADGAPSIGASGATDATATPVVVADTAAKITPASDIHGTFAGSTPGLYGGTMNKATCNATQMVTFLKANPDKAAAWAGVLGIPTDQIEAFVSRLTPTVLRADTAVTNHGFRDGRSTELRSVLQAGTAVLVNDQGEPVVKCGCGNPLTAPPAKSARTYSGAQWPAFNPSSVIEVTRTADPVNEFVLVNEPTHTAFSRPVGTDGDADLPVTIPPGEALTGGDSSASTTSSTAEPGASAETTTSTEPAPDPTISAPTNDRYNIKLNPTAGDCLGTPGVTGTVDVIGTTIYFTSPEASGELAADGSFDITTVVHLPDGVGGTATYHYHGYVDGTRIAATLETVVHSPGTSANCTVSINGFRAGAAGDTPVVTDPVAPAPETTAVPITIIPSMSADLPLPIERSWYFDLALANNGCEDITVTDGGRGRLRVYDDGHGFQSVTFLGRPSISIVASGGRFFDATVQFGNTVTLSGPTSGALPSIADDSSTGFTYTVVNSPDPECTITFRATRTS